MNTFPVQKNILSQKVFSAGCRWVCSCRVAGVGGQVAGTSSRHPAASCGILRLSSRLAGLGVCPGPGTRAPGVPVHINKLITCCYYYIVHKNEPILGISFIILYNGFIAYFMQL
jgi:hypothetical protein